MNFLLNLNNYKAATAAKNSETLSQLELIRSKTRNFTDKRLQFKQYY